MLIRHGIDLVDIKRHEFKNNKIIKKILSDNEIIEFNTIATDELKIKYIATRWAIKEAIIKCCDKLVPLNEIIISKCNYKYIWANKIFKIVEISTSNESNFIIASVICMDDN